MPARGSARFCRYFCRYLLLWIFENSVPMRVLRGFAIPGGGPHARPEVSTEASGFPVSGLPKWYRCACARPACLEDGVLRRCAESRAVPAIHEQLRPPVVGRAARRLTCLRACRGRLAHLADTGQCLRGQGPAARFLRAKSLCRAPGPKCVRRAFLYVERRQRYRRRALRISARRPPAPRATRRRRAGRAPS